MKKILVSTIIMALTAVAAHSQTTVTADTITSVKNVNRLVIKESPEKMEIIIEGAGNDPQFRNVISQEFHSGTVKSHHPYSTLQSRNPGSTVNFIDNITLLTGMVTAPGDGSVDIEMSKSFEISVPEIIGINIGRRKSASSLSISMGLGWRNYRTTKGSAMTGDGNGNVEVYPNPNGENLKFSRIKMFSISVPVMYRWRTPVRVMRKKMSVRAGAVFNWNTHASLKTSMLKADGNTETFSTDKIGHRKLSVDILGMVNLTPHVGLYCRYCPTPMLRKNHGPQFRTLSAGLAFTL